MSISATADPASAPVSEGPVRSAGARRDPATGPGPLGPVPGPAAVPGQLRVLACAPALCPHAEFAVAAVLEAPVSLTWSDQPAAPGTLQASLSYVAAAGTAGRLAARLRAVTTATFEVVEAASPGVDAERYSYTAALGLHRASLSATGDVVLGEAVVLAAVSRSARMDGGAPADKLAHELHRLLGRPWDDVLEPLRCGGEGAPTSSLRRTG